MGGLQRCADERGVAVAQGKVAQGRGSGGLQLHTSSAFEVPCGRSHGRMVEGTAEQRRRGVCRERDWKWRRCDGRSPGTTRTPVLAGIDIATAGSSVFPAGVNPPTNLLYFEMRGSR